MTSLSPTGSASAAALPTAPRIGLALSGGGFRASLFYIGVLARLAEADLLRRVEVLSCVSGGSIIGALYYLYLKRELDQDGDLDSERLIELVARMERHFLAVVQRNPRWQVFASLGANLRLARADYSRTDRLGDLLDRQLYRPVLDPEGERPLEMRDLPIHPRGDTSFRPARDNAGRHCKVPELIVNATTLNTGHAWRFQADGMGEPRLRPAERRIDKNLLLCQAGDEQLIQRQREMPLGQAVAASAAVPGLFEPFPISGLYRRPDQIDDPDARLRVQLVDGGVYDNLGTEALRERGCDHLLVSDASGQMRDAHDVDSGVGAALGRASTILMDRVRELQLDRLQADFADRLAVMHLTRELAAPEAQPLGPGSSGLVSLDRSQGEVTSYGVQRRLQQALADVRTDLDAFSDTEAFALMADGYLVTRRELEQLAGRHVAWIDDAHGRQRPWRFAALFDPLHQPPPALEQRLDAARLRLFKGLRLVPRLRFEGGALVGLAGVAAVVLALRHQSWLGTMDETAWFRLALGALAAALALPLYLGLRSLARRSGLFAWLRQPLRWLASGAVVLAALPLVVLARVNLRASRMFVEAGRLEALGLRPADPADDPRGRQTAALEARERSRAA
jgi:NTE family protein